MAEGCEQGRLTLEIRQAEHPRLVIAGAIDHLLDGAEALDMAEAQIAGDVDSAHAALADDALDLVAIFQHGTGFQQVLPIHNRWDGSDLRRTYHWIRITSTAQSSLLD